MHGARLLMTKLQWRKSIAEQNTADSNHAAAKHLPTERARQRPKTHQRWHLHEGDDATGITAAQSRRISAFTRHPVTSRGEGKRGRAAGVGREGYLDRAYGRGWRPQPA